MSSDSKRLMRQQLRHREGLQDDIDTFLVLLNDSTLTSVELTV